MQRGGAGDDRIFANVGVDTTYGGPGDDDLWALARADVTRPGADTLAGGEGDDRLHTRDGEADAVSCGPGRDVALLDFADVIADAGAGRPYGSCEDVRRAVPAPGDAAPEDGPETPRG